MQSQYNYNFNGLHMRETELDNLGMGSNDYKPTPMYVFTMILEYG